MTNENKNSQRVSENGRNLILVANIVFGFTAVVLLSLWIDRQRPQMTQVDAETLYLNGTTARRLSLGFNGLAADWYWMRSLQYVGKKIIAARERMEMDDLSQLDLKLLPPMLDITTTLDPQFLEPYEYAAVILPSIDRQEAIRLVSKGIAANPEAWRLYHHLGYIHWQQGDYKTASQIYQKGSTIPDAPPWMEAMSARMEAEGGSRTVAREIYTRMYEQSKDEKVRDMARRRLMQVASLEERDALRKVLATYKEELGRCPGSWREIEGALKVLRWRLDSSGAPLDPSGWPYILDQDRCEIFLDLKSEVPPK
jgi:tetratricopeptide (TPR) repeat protein